MEHLDSRLKASLLITGNEVLFGKTRDTNGPFMAAKLRGAGLRVERILICGDDAHQLQAALVSLSEISDVILMTGGLGPTSDDLTAQVVGSFFGSELRFFPKAWEACVEAFARLGRTEVPESNRKQAMLPAEAQLIPNLVGTAVGFSVKKTLPVPSKVVQVVCLPGVPFELEPMFVDSVLPSLRISECELFSQSWQVFQLGESLMQEKLNELEAITHKRFPDTVLSYQAHAGSVTYSLTYPSLPSSKKQDFLSFFEQDFVPFFKKAMAHHIVSVGSESLAETVVKDFRSTGLHLSLAESCTGGRISDIICQVSGSSDCYLGGVVCYSNFSKVELLGLQPESLEKFGAVSEQVAKELATGCRRRFGSDVAVAVTGIAGPGGGSAEKPVGTVFVSLCVSSEVSETLFRLHRLEDFGWVRLERGEALSTDSVFVKKLSLGSRLPRQVVQLRACQFVLGSLVAAVSQT